MGIGINRIRRLGGMAGVGFVVLAVVSLLLAGAPPKATEVLKIGPYLVGKRSDILASDYVLGVAFVLFLLFVGALREHLGAAGREGFRPGSAALAGGVLAASMVLAGTAVLNGAAFQVAGDGNVALNHALYDVGNDVFAMAGFGLATFFVGAAVAISATGAMPSWLSPAGLVAAVVNLVGAVALFANSGFFAIGGAFGFISPLVSILWVLAASIVLWRSPWPADSVAAAAPVDAHARSSLPASRAEPSSAAPRRDSAAADGG